jgi:hypothetical protein
MLKYSLVLTVLMVNRKEQAKKFLKNNKTSLFLLILSFLLLLFAKRFFFICLFIFLNYLILWMKFGIGIDSPIEVISFGTFMLAYKYSSGAAFVLLVSDIIALAITTRIKIDKLITVFSLFIIALSSPLLKEISLPLAGILALAFKYLIDIIWNWVIMKNDEYYGKIPQKVINSVFWIIFYIRFGDGFASLMI